MDDNNNTSDDIGIRVSGSSLSYSANQSSAWTGAGLINKPIVDFFAGTYNNPGNLFTSINDMQVPINSAIILEPEEYALLSGLFALGFVLFHRQMQKKQKATAS